MPFCFFAVGLIVLPTQLLIGFWSDVSGAFSSSEALLFSFSLLARTLVGFLEGFLDAFFSSSEALLSSDGDCSYGTWTPLNVGLPSMSGRDVVAIEVMFL